MTAMDVDERQQLAHSVRAACERLAPEDRVRAVAYDSDSDGRGIDIQLWKVLCNQVGVTAIALPDHLGGAGFGATALGVVAHELGRALAPVPFLASAVLATGLLVELRDEDTNSADRLAELVEGNRTAAAVLTDNGGLWRPGAVTLTAEPTTDGWSVTGVARHVLNGHAADDLVVAAIAERRPALFLVDAAAAGVSAEREPVLDRTRPMATLAFTGAPAVRLSGNDPVDDILGRTVDLAIAVLTAEQVGACERVLEISTDYARTREQFNRPIGSFQAIKHKCADMLIDLEWARSASQAALQAADGDMPGELGWRSSMAKAVCSEALRRVANANVQVHGGIGFTWEDSAHLYVRRACTDEVLFGRPADHWDRLAVEAKIL